ncbi:hypothetical protein [Streptococcus peroris]|uniref:hypothetical protein n=1 Tax=Streptococcus peroris TaxID=68891 RepID=UPI0039C05C10
MSIKDGVNNLYEIVNLFKKITDYTFYLNIILALVSIYFNYHIILVLQLITVLTNILVSFFSDSIYFPKAEEERLRTNIKNAFGVDITEYDTDGYYNNKQPHSIHKVILNTFENIFFTKNIIDIMIVKDLLKPILSGVLLVVVFVFFQGEEHYIDCISINIFQ